LNFECDNTKIDHLLNENESHTVLFDSSSLKCADLTGPPLAYSFDYVDKWNEPKNYVRMPFSKFNIDENTNANKWDEITQSFNQLLVNIVKDSKWWHIENTIKQYSHKKRFNFNALSYFFNKELQSEYSNNILTQLLPKIVKLALNLPNLIKKPIPILKRGTMRSVTLSQEQAASLLANAFFCTFPEMNDAEEEDEDIMPFINFNHLFSQSKRTGHSSRIEKIKCCLHYFERVTKKMPTGVITYQRQIININNDLLFKDMKKSLRKPIIRLDGTIEDCPGALQVNLIDKTKKKRDSFF
jgi:poly(ADP-ribose) glycohydrolase